MSNIEYEAFKNYYLQHPITFLTEENLDKLETHCRKAINYERGFEHKVVLELLERYKEYLAEREQKDKKIKELEEHLKKYYDGEIYTAKQLKQIEENQKKYFINKQKVKDEIERYEYMLAETIHGEIQKYTPGEILLKIDTLKELLEEK